jgi:hypothetical protein
MRYIVALMIAAVVLYARWTVAGVESHIRG